VRRLTKVIWSTVRAPRPIVLASAAGQIIGLMASTVLSQRPTARYVSRLSVVIPLSVSELLCDSLLCAPQIDRLPNITGATARAANLALLNSGVSHPPSFHSNPLARSLSCPPLLASSLPARSCAAPKRTVTRWSKKQMKERDRCLHMLCELWLAPAPDGSLRSEARPTLKLLRNRFAKLIRHAPSSKPHLDKLSPSWQGVYLNRILKSGNRCNDDQCLLHHCSVDQLDSKDARSCDLEQDRDVEDEDDDLADESSEDDFDRDRAASEETKGSADDVERDRATSEETKKSRDMGIQFRWRSLSELLTGRTRTTSGSEKHARLHDQHTKLLSSFSASALCPAEFLPTHPEPCERYHLLRDNTVFFSAHPTSPPSLSAEVVRGQRLSALDKLVPLLVTTSPLISKVVSIDELEGRVTDIFKACGEELPPCLKSRGKGRRLTQRQLKALLKQCEPFRTLHQKTVHGGYQGFVFRDYDGAAAAVQLAASRASAAPMPSDDTATELSTSTPFASTSSQAQGSSSLPPSPSPSQSPDSSRLDARSTSLSSSLSISSPVSVVQHLDTAPLSGFVAQSAETTSASALHDDAIVLGALSYQYTQVARENGEIATDIQTTSEDLQRAQQHVTFLSQLLQKKQQMLRSNRLTLASLHALLRKRGH
jgi:hypothetical protein